MKSCLIAPRPCGLGGWLLRLFENGREVGIVVFQLAESDPQAAAVWWNGLPPRIGQNESFSPEPRSPPTLGEKRWPMLLR